MSLNKVMLLKTRVQFLLFRTSEVSLGYVTYEYKEKPENIIKCMTRLYNDYLTQNQYNIYLIQNQHCRNLNKVINCYYIKKSKKHGVIDINISSVSDTKPENNL